MQQSDQVGAYTMAGLDSGVMAPTHLYHASQASEVIKNGDCVIDLACGPGGLLNRLASLHPDVSFVGIDLSRPMLQVAQEHAFKTGLTNVTFKLGDITALTSIGDESADVVMSSMSLHHLPRFEMLKACMLEIRRILKPDGGIYLADFARLKSIRSMRAFAFDHADRQSDLFTRDYLNSLKAAWSVAEMAEAMKPIANIATLYKTFGIRMMMAVKSKIRRPYDAELKANISAIRDTFDDQQEADMRNIIRFLRMGGLKTMYLDGKRSRVSVNAHAA